MQTAAPLARSVRNAVATSTSRIPHLEYHILRKLDRSQRLHARSDGHGCQQQLRHRSTAADPSFTFPSWGTSEVELSTKVREEEASPKLSSPRVSEPHKVDFIASQIVQQTSTRTAGFVDLATSSSDISATKLLEEASPERLLAWLTSHATGAAFVVAAENHEFDKAFCALDPRILVDPFKQAQRHLQKHRVDDPELQFERSLVERLRRFAAQIDSLLVKRQETGVPLSLNTCRHALKCAASVGDVRMADHIWKQTMRTNKLVPDLECYNAYLHAHNWNLAYSDIARTSFRNTQRNMNLRSEVWRPKNLLGYSVKPGARMPDPDWTLKAKILALFQEVSSKGLVTDEEVFTNLIIGLARAGDLPGVDSILKSVWNIDVHALGNFDEEELESPTYYPDTHPLRPSDKLLFAIVHVYSINSSPAKAWTILDYTSRNYALDIPEYVWNELFEWTFVLSRPRGLAKRLQGQAAGTIPMSELDNLLSTVTDAPYNLKPNAMMLNMLARNHQRKRHLDNTLRALEQAETGMMQHLEQLQLMVDTIKAITKDLRGITDNGLLSHKFIDFRREFQLVFLSAIEQYNYLVLQTKRVLQEDDWAGSGREQTWQRRRLPQVVEQLKSYLPNYCEYKTKTGRVTLHFSNHRGQAVDDGPTRTLLFEATAIWRAMEPTDLFQLAENLKTLPTRLNTAQREPRGVKY